MSLLILFWLVFRMTKTGIFGMKRSFKCDGYLILTVCNVCGEILGFHGVQLVLCDCSCNSGYASFFNSATIVANFLHFRFIGSTKFGKCVVTSIFVLILLIRLLELVQLQEQQWYWLVVILERDCCQHQKNW